MTLLRAITRGLLALPFLALATQACVRLDEPDSFPCSTPDDCLANETCGSAGRCIARGSCNENIDCQDAEYCLNQECVPAECTQDPTPACGSYKCNSYERSCYKSCAGDYQCNAGYLCDGTACRPFANLANGSPCKYAFDCTSKICCINTSHLCSLTCSP